MSRLALQTKLVITVIITVVVVIVVGVFLFLFLLLDHQYESTLHGSIVTDILSHVMHLK